MHDALSDIRQRTWDFWLTVATVVLLGCLGVQSFIGTGYSWWAQRTIPGWEQTGYDTFVRTMNAIAAPQVVALVVIMGLCVPKRLFARRPLVVVSALMLLVGVAIGGATGSLASGLGAYLLLAALIQVAVVVLTLAGARSPSYLTEGRLTKVGSGLLHLGFVLICLVVITLQNSRFTLPAFWIAASAVLVGTALSFWSGRFAYRRDRESLAQETPPASDEGALEMGEERLEVPDHRSDESGSEFDELR